MSDDSGIWTVVLPVTGFITISIDHGDSSEAASRASTEANRLLGKIDFTVALGQFAGHPAVLRVDPLAEGPIVSARGAVLEPHEASRARIRTRRMKAVKGNG